MSAPLRAFHGDAAIKAEYLARVERHRLADAIVQGVYWQHGRGCAVGCTIEGSDHARFETELGIPRMVACLEDTIFEGLTAAEARDFPAAVLQAIPVGADLSCVGPQFLLALITRVRDTHATDASRPAMDQVVAVLATWVETGRPPVRATARAAYAAARAAYAAAAAAYAAAAAAHAAADAAHAAAAAAAAAAHAAAAYAAADAAADAAAAERRWQRDILLALLAAAPVPEVVA